MSAGSADASAEKSQQDFFDGLAALSEEGAVFGVAKKA